MKSNELRDEFALAVIPALIARETAYGTYDLADSGCEPAVLKNAEGDVILTIPRCPSSYNDTEMWDEVANAAYALADAMLRARDIK